MSYNHMHADTHTCIHSHTHTFKVTHTDTHTNSDTHSHLHSHTTQAHSHRHKHVHSDTITYMHTHIHTHTHMCIQTCIQSQTHSHTHANSETLSHKQSHTHIHCHLQSHTHSRRQPTGSLSDVVNTGWSGAKAGSQEPNGLGPSCCLGVRAGLEPRHPRGTRVSRDPAAVATPPTHAQSREPGLQHTEVGRGPEGPLASGHLGLPGCVQQNLT